MRVNLQIRTYLPPVALISTTGNDWFGTFDLSMGKPLITPPIFKIDSMEKSFAIVIEEPPSPRFQDGAIGISPTIIVINTKDSCVPNSSYCYPNPQSIAICVQLGWLALK
jgi:hypothetical protein